MATLNRDRRLPGQSSRYRDHPSNVGSPSYYADTGRGWSNPGVSRNKKVDRGGGWKHPVSPTRRGDNRFAQQTLGGGEGRGGQGNIYRPSGVHPGRGSGAPGGIGGGITTTAPGQQYITKSTDKDEEKQAAFDHRATAHFAPWWGDVMDKFGGLTEGALRGSRLHKDYKDAYGGSKEWENDKRAMMTDDERAFEKKYLKLASMATDNEKAQEYRDTAETAWRNKQTSDRLAAYTDFEDYDPGKYSGLGEGSRYTGDVYEGQGRTGEFVPGVGIMDDIIDRLYQSEGAPQDYKGYEGNEYDLENQIKLLENQTIPDEIFEGINEDITADLDYTPYPDEKWGAPVMTPSMLDDYYEQGEFPVDEQYSTWGDPGFYNERSRLGGWNNMNRKFGDLSKRNSGFISPFTRKGALPFEPNVGMGYVDNLTVNPNLIEEEETFIKPNTNLRGRLGLYD